MDFEIDHPGMGYGVTFPRPDWTIDIYIYDLKMKSIPDDPASAAVQAALDEAKGEIVNTAKRGDYAGLTVKDVFTIADTAGRGRLLRGVQLLSQAACGRSRQLSLPRRRQRRVLPDPHGHGQKQAPGR